MTARIVVDPITRIEGHLFAYFIFGHASGNLGIIISNRIVGIKTCK